MHTCAICVCASTPPGLDARLSLPELQPLRFRRAACPMGHAEALTHPADRIRSDDDPPSDCIGWLTLPWRSSSESKRGSLKADNQPWIGDRRVRDWELTGLPVVIDFPNLFMCFSAIEYRSTATPAPATLIEARRYSSKIDTKRLVSRPSKGFILQENSMLGFSITMHGEYDARGLRWALEALSCAGSWTPSPQGTSADASAGVIGP